MAKLLFFGATAEIVGAHQIERPVSRSADLLSDLLNEFPRLASQKLLVSVNQEYISGDRQLNDGDEIAIFTPVSGG